MQRARELEMLLLAMLAPVPLYFTDVIALPPLIAFHVATAVILAALLLGRSPEILPLALMRVLALGYIVFYPIDIAVISGHAITASTHLILFISVYQAMEWRRARNDALRLLTASLLFIASISTATHLTIVLFVVAFAFLMIRQLMAISHQQTAELLGREPSAAPSNRSAFFYLGGMIALGILLFPLMPRLRNPLLNGVGAPVFSGSTGLSDTINFNRDRTITPDASVVSRVSMSSQAFPYFTPLRLRGLVYDRFRNNEWLQPIRIFHPIAATGNSTRLAHPHGFARPALIQQQPVLGGRLYLPAGTYEVDDLPIIEAPTRDVYLTTAPRNKPFGFSVRMANEITPLQARPPHMPNYPITPAVAALAAKIVGNERDPMRQSKHIEEYLSTRFEYIPDPARLNLHMTVDEFLLRERRGHCEYFAAGMVALLTSLKVPSRIVGGFYGGTFNPLTGYFILRREDAHAWVEVWDGAAWRTFDPTPATMRPGVSQQGLLRIYATAISDSLNFFWDRYILTFGLADQVALLFSAITSGVSALTSFRQSIARVPGLLASPQVFLPLICSILLFALLSMIVMTLRRSTFDLLARHLRRRGIELGPATTMEEALQRLTPADRAPLAPLIAMYEAERFSAEGKRAKRAVKRKLAEIGLRTE